MTTGIKSTCSLCCGEIDTLVLYHLSLAICTISSGDVAAYHLKNNIIMHCETLVYIGGRKGGARGAMALLNFKALHRNSIFAIEKS